MKNRIPPFAVSALFLFTLSALAEESRISRVTLTLSKWRGRACR